MSSNELTSERSMNGIIDVFAGSIRCDTIDANTIIVDNETINNSLTVDNVTLAPVEISQLTGINTDETIQQQINSIEAELLNVVHKTGNETISGTKNFTNTIQLTSGNLLTNNPLFSPANTTITSAQLSTLKNINTSMTIQQQINNVGIDGFMDLPSQQVATGRKIFTNGLQTPSITNQETSGTVNGFFINSNQLLYTSYSGTFTLNVSLCGS